jgi:multiple sugar transport system permease protein
MADIAAPSAIARRASRSSLHKLMQRKSTVAFLMALPLILLILILVAYPAGYAVWLATLNKSMTKFVGLGTSTSCSSARPSGRSCCKAVCSPSPP